MFTAMYVEKHACVMWIMDIKTWRMWEVWRNKQQFKIWILVWHNTLEQSIWKRTQTFFWVSCKSKLSKQWANVTHNCGLLSPIDDRNYDTIAWCSTILSLDYQIIIMIWDVLPCNAKKLSLDTHLVRVIKQAWNYCLYSMSCFWKEPTKKY